jgi:circadian clock protein KaiC
VLRELEENEERNRGLYVVKSRGMAHSNQVREFLLTNRGVKLVPAALGATGVSPRSAAKQNKLERTGGQKKQRRGSQQRSAVARIRKVAAAYQGKPFLAKAAGDSR